MYLRPRPPRRPLRIIGREEADHQLRFGANSRAVLREALLMSENRDSHRKSHVLTEHPPFERIALLLQGGGALGSYQAGVYQALAEANLQPQWVAGISIGAVNAALIAGNPPEARVEKLREFWEAVSTPPLGFLF